MPPISWTFGSMIAVGLLAQKPVTWGRRLEEMEIGFRSLAEKDWREVLLSWHWALQGVMYAVSKLCRTLSAWFSRRTPRRLRTLCLSCGRGCVAPGDGSRFQWLVSQWCMWRRSLKKLDSSQWQTIRMKLAIVMAGLASLGHVHRREPLVMPRDQMKYALRSGKPWRIPEALIRSVGIQLQMHQLEGLPYEWWALCFCFVKLNLGVSFWIVTPFKCQRSRRGQWAWISVHRRQILLERGPRGLWCGSVGRQLEHFKSGAHFTWWRNWWICNWLAWALIRLKMCRLEHTHWWLNDVILLAPVSKQAMITEVQRLARIAKDNFLIARDLVPENMTEHFMRRSGAKLMARKGCSFCDVDLRGGSMVWEPYRDSWRMADELATRDMMNNALTKVNSVEEAVKIA